METLRQVEERSNNDDSEAGGADKTNTALARSSENAVIGNDAAPTDPTQPVATMANMSIHSMEPHLARTEGIFPPTLYSHAFYKNGIRLFPQADVTRNEEESDDGTSMTHASTNPSDYSAYASAGGKRRNSSNHTNLLPFLSPEEASMWKHKWAAKSAVQGFFPMTTFRLLGTITRMLVVTDDTQEGPLAQLQLSTEIPPPKKKARSKPPKMTRPSAKVEARMEQAENIEERADEIHQNWVEKYDQGSVPRKGWDVHGELCRQAVNDTEYVPVHQMLEWVCRRQVDDAPGQPTVRSLYNGLCNIPIDTRTILRSLLELSSTDGLYEIPLILPYAVARKVHETTTSVSRSTHDERGRVTKAAKTESLCCTWKIRIGVYAHRLLPEVMTCSDLHVIMSALDIGSYRTMQPLHLPSIPKEPAFACNPFPKVVFDDVRDNEDMSDSDDEEKKCDDVVDATIGGSTRQESKISAFSTAGFLKLLENTGNDVSNWPEIEAKIAPAMKLELMLHQKHAISWMVEMESLGGFGINSLLWEERAFIDGGTYYYSPALGQIRLAKPQTMRGGLLCDEQGLGKTVEVLGLIVATLDDLKCEAEAFRETVENPLMGAYSHATLIVVPPALVSQWFAEIDKAFGDELIVEYFDHRSRTFLPQGEKRGTPDVVVTTYTALEKNVAARFLTDCSWGRIVLDEMQEVRSSTTKIARMCDSLKCERRWMLSGTPLFDGITDLKGELNFLRLEPYSAKTEDGFFDFSITNHWKRHSMHGMETLRILSTCMLRRSKSMTILSSGRPLLGLKPLTVEYRPIPQDLAERALYCFWESIVGRELKSLVAKELKSGTTRQLCLRLLRELAVAPMLLNGGLGVSSQLATLNQLMIRENRREMEGNGFTTTLHGGAKTIMSCDEAIRYLSQAQEHAHVGEDFVTSQEMGLGGGLSNRSRAVESVEAQRAESYQALENAKSALRGAKKKRARAFWHLALEKITTGQLRMESSVRGRISARIQRLWRWRSLVILMSKTSFLNRNKKLPALLMRGWRPSKSFCEIELPSRHPEFLWAHSHSYQLQQIPAAVAIGDVSAAIQAVLESNQTQPLDEPDQRMEIVSYSSSSGSWNAIVRFNTDADLKLVSRRATSTNGIALPSKQAVPEVLEMIKCAEEKFEEATAQHKVYPCITSQRELTSAKRALDRAQMGLRIVCKKADNELHVLMGDALGATRSLKPASWYAFYDKFTEIRDQLNEIMGRNSVLVQEHQEKLARLEAIAKNRLDEHVQTLSTFDSLQALSTGEQEMTMCPICLGKLGSQQDEESSLIAMTKCGHLYCEMCLQRYVASRGAFGNSACPSCRRALGEVIYVDPSKPSDEEALFSKRKEAKRVVLEASRMLDESNGQLDAHMWEKLYLAIDLPAGTDTSRHNRFTAIPKDVLGHLRNATVMPLDSKPTNDPTRDVDRCLSSKIRALLTDLPRGERSVVFSSSKALVKHLVRVFELKNIGCRTIYSGQNVLMTQNVMNDWESVEIGPEGSEIIPYPVLVLQAGAAASGLTLTAACKMFLMEPFLRQEEEQQAFARCHRYGQKYAVHCTCYVSPVSVESRLLEWRRRAARDGNEETFAEEETRVVYAGIRDEDESDAERLSEKAEASAAAEGDDEVDRTSFLLGLTGDQNLSPAETTEVGPVLWT